MEKGVKFTAYAGIFIGTGVALGYLLVGVPNVELVTATIFLAGYIIGKNGGIIVGILTFGIFSSLNPYGMSPLPLLFTQILAGGVIGFTGGFIKGRQEGIISFTLSGIFLTLFYDLATNASGYFLFPQKNTFIVYMIAGIGFSGVHILSNGIIFPTLLFPLTKNLKRRLV